MKQYKPDPTSFGGDLMKKRQGRGARPLGTYGTMHLVLRSSQAKGPKSFKRHDAMITKALEKFARKYAITIHGFANVGNHLHIHLKLASKRTWRAFIRAFTATIAVKVGGKSRWAARTKRFWDRRPFTRVVHRSGFGRMVTYIKINILESQGFDREEARAYLSGIPPTPPNRKS